MASWDADVKLDAGVPNGSETEYCWVHSSRSSLDGRQILVEHPSLTDDSGNPLKCVLTVDDTTASSADDVEVNQNTLDDYFDSNTFNNGPAVGPAVCIYTATTQAGGATAETNAETNSTTFDWYEDDVTQDKLLLMALHAGNIEDDTGEIIEAVYDNIGDRSGDKSILKIGAFRDWTALYGDAWPSMHIHAEDMHDDSYPGVKYYETTRANKFNWTLSVHGWSEAYIGVGGNGPAEEKDMLAAFMRKATNNTVTVTVLTAGYGSGTDANNPVNACTDYPSGSVPDGRGAGLQLEFPLAVRSTYYDEIVLELTRFCLYCLEDDLT